MLRREEQDIKDIKEFLPVDLTLSKIEGSLHKPLQLLWLSDGNSNLAVLLQLMFMRSKSLPSPPKIVVTSQNPGKTQETKVQADLLENYKVSAELIEKYLVKDGQSYVPRKSLLRRIEFIDADISLFFDYPTPDILFFAEAFNKKSFSTRLYEIATYLTASSDTSPLFYFLALDQDFIKEQRLLQKNTVHQESNFFKATGLHENYLEQEIDEAHAKAFLKLGRLTAEMLKKRNEDLEKFNETIEEHNKILENSNEFLNKTSQEISDSFAKLQKANSLLKQNEAFINAVFQVADVGLSIIDSEGKIMKMNREFCHIYLFNENELLNLPLATLLPKSKTSEYILAKNNKGHYQNNFSEVSDGVRKDKKKITVLSSTSKIILKDEVFYINTVRDITKSTKDLHLLHDTLNSLKIGGWEYELHNKKLFVTDELYNILNLGKDFELNESSIQNFMSVEQLAELKKDCKALVDKKDAIIRELTATTGRGEMKILKITARSVFHNNLMVRIAGTVQDITQAKLKEKKIRENEQLYKTLIANFPGGTIDIIDEKYNYVFTGGKELEDLPQNPEDVLGKSIYELYDERLAKKLAKYLKRCLEGEQLTFDIDYQGKYWNVFSIPLFNEEKEVDKVMLLTQNITLQRKADKGLKETHKSLSDFRKALDVASYVAIMNEEAQISYLNDNLIKLSGYPKDALINQSFDAILDKEKLVPAFFEEIKTTLLNGDIWKGELICRTKDNDIFWLNMSIIPFLDENGAPYQFLAVGSNDTVRKKAEEQIKIQNKELTRINAELDRFVYSTSHDIRSPLVSILGLINIARLELTEGDPVKEYLGMIEKSVKKLDKFVQEIIHYSQNARMEVKYEQIDFEEEVNAVFDSLKQFDGHSDIELRLDYVVESPFYSDTNRLRAIFKNLLTNSIIYQRNSVPQSFVEVKVRANKYNALIEVKDNGIGISEEYIDKVFDMFFKATTFSSGSGLGLYVVKESLNILDGDIQVESKQNEGATFIIDIPNGARDIDIIS